MAYNREWDKGNESWGGNEYNHWNNGGGSSSIRGREEDYYHEGKRRKFNNGVRSSNLIVNSPNMRTGS